MESINTYFRIVSAIRMVRTWERERERKRCINFLYWYLTLYTFICCSLRRYFHSIIECVFLIMCFKYCDWGFGFMQKRTTAIGGLQKSARDCVLWLMSMCFVFICIHLHMYFARVWNIIAVDTCTTSSLFCIIPGCKLCSAFVKEAPRTFKITMNFHTIGMPAAFCRCCVE